MVTAKIREKIVTIQRQKQIRIKQRNIEKFSKNPDVGQESLKNRFAIVHVDCEMKDEEHR